MNLPVLSTFYYHDHFMEMLCFVTDIYGGILDEEHHRFILDFEALPKDEQCFYIRMANRKGFIFHRDGLRYDEIADHPSVIAALIEKGFARYLEPCDFPAWLQTFSKVELCKILRILLPDGIAQSWPKDKLKKHAEDVLSFETMRAQCGADKYIVRTHIEKLDFLLFLFFGKTELNMKSFALRDLGLVQVRKGSNFSARFECENEAKDCFRYTRLIADLHNGIIQDYDALFHHLIETEETSSSAASMLRSKALFLCAQYFEEEAQSDKACALYEKSHHPESKARLIRLLWSGDEREKAKTILEQIIDNPNSDDEFYFASDFYARKFNKQKLSSQTSLLRNGIDIKIDEAYRDSPEYGVQCHYAWDQWQAWHTENGLWRCLFGLIFWDELFCDTRNFHSGFDRLPQKLKEKTFATVFSREIERKLHALKTGDILKGVMKTFSTCHGQPNSVFAWYQVDIETIKILLGANCVNATATILEMMARDFDCMKDGFPDLLLSRNEETLFVEVKAEGDVIRRNQLTRLKQLEKAGFNCRIARVNYNFNPDQDYVIVDVETTGGRSAQHRITEIGAVKIRNHEVVDEWHSLINPRRSIPANITRLTGISNDMVAQAPLFSEIADSFQDFMGSAIFSAHNVNFDYGFMATEYQRLERKFKYPKLCTCAGMRRYYPGHKSYSLANLCETYGIGLDNHHRALCDAKAAAHLLNLINRRREELAA